MQNSAEALRELSAEYDIRDIAIAGTRTVVFNWGHPDEMGGWALVHLENGSWEIRPCGTTLSADQRDAYSYSAATLPEVLGFITGDC